MLGKSGLGTEVKRNWVRPIVVLCLLSSPAFVGVGVLAAWKLTDGWQDWSWINLLLSIFVLVATVVMGVGMVVAAIEYTKDK